MMTTSVPKIAIVYLSFHSEPYMDDVISALKRLTYPKDRVEFVIVDNPHPEYGPSVRYLEENVLPLSAKEIPHVTLLPQKENLGFSGGNNVGIRWAMEHGYEYVYFHNNDGFMAATCLEPLVETMENDKDIGVAQSLMLLYPETVYVNSAGNSLHYLGFGFCLDYRRPLADLSLPPVKEISYASGAAVMMRTSLLKTYGLWDDDFFLYHEDLEYSLRLQMAGYRSVVVKDSIFYHKYQFSRSITKFFWMERNRYAVLYMFFRLPTLLLLFPMLFVLEVGLWVFAVKNHWVKERIRVYRYWLNPRHWPLWHKKRRYIQSIRTIRDRDILLRASPGIYFQEKTMANPLLTYIGNPLMAAYYFLIVKGFIRW